MASSDAPALGAAKGIAARLESRPVVLVGLMGAGKTTVGRRLAQRLELPFFDADAEIEAAARMTVAEIFAAYGEAEFRALEARVVGRLADAGPSVLATGGGAFVAAPTRELLLRRAVAVWLRADLDTLMERVLRRNTRPLLKTGNPRETMRALMDARYPIYAQAHLTVQSRAVKREVVAEEVIAALDGHLPPEAAEAEAVRA